MPSFHLIQPILKRVKRRWCLLPLSRVGGVGLAALATLAAIPSYPKPAGFFGGFMQNIVSFSNN